MIPYFVIAYFVLFSCLPFFHYGTLSFYQQSAYRISETFAMLLRIRARRYLLSSIVVVLLFLLALLFNSVLSGAKPFLILLPLSCFCISVGVYRHKKARVKLRFTARMKRFSCVFGAFSAAFGVILTLLYLPLIAVSLPLGGLMGLITAHLVTSPIERKRNARFVALAEKRLADHSAVKVGITGSYGKTTAKSILSVFLSEEYPTCATRENYNTPMGIAISVNNDLLDDDRFFVAEMGARHIGDIAELCRIVKPSVSLLTAIGNQHLSTFGSYDGVLSTKGEIIDGTDKDGFVVLNADNDGCKKLISRGITPKFLTGKDETAIQLVLSGNAHESDFAAFYGNVTVDEKGTCFILVLDGKAYEIQTELISPYAPSAITQCAFAAYKMGISPEKIKNAAKKLKPVAHRLQLLYNGNDAIIDDAYNGSVESITAALSVLANFSAKTRVVITPGVVELGEEQYAANYGLGKLASCSSDYALFVGINSAALRQGAIDGGMKKERAVAVNSLIEATEKLKEIQGERAILFANDLPDCY